MTTVTMLTAHMLADEITGAPDNEWTAAPFDGSTL